MCIRDRDDTFPSFKSVVSPGGAVLDDWQDDLYD
jgi:hypothetical protein